MPGNDDSCPPQWRYNRLDETGPESPYGEKIDRQVLEIERLNHEIMKMKVYIQSEELKDLDERHFRDTHPSVKDAWDQYQTLIRLAKDG